MSGIIFARDLGKYKSIGCVYDPAYRQRDCEVVFWTLRGESNIGIEKYLKHSGKSGDAKPVGHPSHWQITSAIQETR